MDQVVTGEAVAIDLRPARLGSRVIAGLIDLVFQSFLLYAVLVAALVLVHPQDDALTAAVILVVYITTMLGYPVGCETFLRGRTVGKIVLGLRVVRDDGGPIRFRQAFTRGLIGAVVERPGALFGLPAVIAMITSSRSKRLGDLFAGTVVLHESVPVTAGVAPAVPPPLAGWVIQLDLSGLDDDLVSSTRQFLGRVHELSPEARERIGAGLVARMLAVVTPQPPPGTPGWAYLSAVLAERTRRAYRRLRSVSRARYGPGDLPDVPVEYWPAHFFWADLGPAGPGAAYAGGQLFSVYPTAAGAAPSARHAPAQGGSYPVAYPLPATTSRPAGLAVPAASGPAGNGKPPQPAAPPPYAQAAPAQQYQFPQAPQVPPGSPYPPASAYPPASPYPPAPQHSQPPPPPPPPPSPPPYPQP